MISYGLNPRSGLAGNLNKIFLYREIDAQYLRDFVAGNGLAEKEPLHDVTAQTVHDQDLLFGLDAFGNQGIIEGIGQTDNGADKQ